GDVPEADGAVARAGGQGPAIREKGHTVHGAFVALQHAEWAASGDVPETDSPVGRAARRQHAPVRGAGEGANAPSCPAARCSGRPVVASHTCRTSSLPAVAIALPSGENATARVASARSRMTRRSFPVATSQRWRVSPTPAPARVEPSREKARAFNSGF